MLLTQKMPLKSASLPGFDPLQLLSIFETSQQISIIARPKKTEISSYLQQVSGQLSTGARLTLHHTEATPVQLDRQWRLPEAAGKEDLLADISLLVGLYADLMDCASIGIRLEVLTHAMCPKFHIDRTGIRLLCTYLGPGTEWLDEAYCNRGALAGTHSTAEAFHQALVVHPQGICQAPEHAVVLLKGSLGQGNQHAGIVHRSPAMSATDKRVVLALDAIW